MAGIARSFILLLTLSSMSSFCEGGCHQSANPVIRMCTPGTVTGSALFIDANVTVQSGEMCSCTVTQSQTGNLFMSPIVGSVTSCEAHIQFYNPVSSTEATYDLNCLTLDDYDRPLNAGSQMAFNLTGNGRMNSCTLLEARQSSSQLTVVCSAKVQIGTTLAPPPTTAAPVTTTTPRPSTEPPTPSSQPPTPSSQPPAPSSQPPTPSTQPPTPSSQPPTPSTQPPTPSTQPPTPSSQPPTPSSQPPTPSSQPPATSGQPPATSGQPPATSGQPPATSGQPPATSATTQPPLPGSTEAIYRFPVPEVAGGVAAAIFVIILLVICVTCCTSRRRSERKPDEESLKGRESPEMQENKEGRGYAFDNILYHASQRDLTGKTVTPTPSNADLSDYQGTKGLEDMYASVNKQITESTAIM